MRVTAVFLFLLSFMITAFSQKAGRDTLQTDDGELTMTMPAGCYSNFYDRDGIAVYDRNSRDTFRLMEMRVLSCYHDGALMNVEIYETARAKSAAKAMQKTLKINGGEVNVGKDFYAVGQIANRENYVLEQRLVASDKRIYLITAASRQTANKTMKDFLDSVQFTDENTAKPDANSVVISSLENVFPQVITEKDTVAAPLTNHSVKEDKKLKSIIALSIPAPSYTEAARKFGTNGRISLRLTFGAEGRITRLQVVRDLPHGLIRETVIAALRIKFLPAELDGKPHPAIQLIGYEFAR